MTRENPGTNGAAAPRPPTAPRPATEPNAVRERTQSRVEKLVAECLAHEGEERSTVVARVLRGNPRDAEAIKACLRSLETSGFMHEARDHGSFAIPDQLGDFRIVRRLGGGGMGEVFLARQGTLSRTVALKLIRPECLFFQHSRERFVREVEAVARLQHPGIVPIYTTGEEHGIPYFAMEWIAGRTLAEVLKQVAGRPPERLTGEDLRRAATPPVSPADGVLVPAPRGPGLAAGHGLFAGTWVEACLRIARVVADALVHAHGRGVMHRDIKPSNVMVTPDGRVVLLDFGIASFEGSAKLTLTGSTIGSLDYMSPEQVLGESGPPDPRSDVYSLGTMLYEMLALRAPYASGDNALTRRRILEGQPTPLRTLNRCVFAEAQTVCLKAMERDIERRYSGALALAADLANLLEHRPISARPPGVVLRARRWCQRHPAASVALGMGLLAGVGGPAAFGLQQAAAVHRYARLADIKIVRRELAAASSLWPATQRQVPAMRTWLDQARTLAARAVAHQEALADLRARGTTVDGRLVFAEQEDDWQHEVLTDLVAQMAEFKDVVAKVERRLHSTIQAHATSLDSDAARRAWEEARAAVRTSPRYHGLDLPPQFGLVPLGPDPRSGLWEFWHVQTGARPEHAPGDRGHVVGPATGIVFVLLPGGRFRMGSYPETPGRPAGRPLVDPDRDERLEGPAHDVTLEAFFLGKHEMTQGQWSRLTGSNPSGLQDRVVMGEEIGPANPVDSLTWVDADLWLTRFNLVLPTEAQWEYACRSGTTTVYAFGNEPEQLLRHGNVADRRYAQMLGRPGEEWTDGHIGTAPVGSYEPNPSGLYDMHGNVAEFCRDHLVSYECPWQPGDGLRAPPSGQDNNGRVARGGACSLLATAARSAARTNVRLDFKNGGYGLRAARRIERE